MRAGEAAKRRGGPDFGSPGWRTLVILSLYGYQGMVAGVAVSAVPNAYAAAGASAAAIGSYVALVGLPWTLQPLWGPVVDRFGGFRMGRRRFWVLAGLLGALAALACLPWAGEGPGALPRLGLVFLCHSAAASLADTATDGMIIDRVPEGELGRATALTRTGFAGGTALGAALFAWAIPAWGLMRAALLLLALGALAATSIILVREAPEDDRFSLRRLPWPRYGHADSSFGHMFRGLIDALRRRETLALLALCIAEEFAVGAFGVRLAVSMVQEGGWDPAGVSRLQSALVLGAGTVGAVLIGWWSDRAGPFRALAALLGLCVLAHLAAAGLLLGEASLGAMAAAMALVLSGVAPALFFVALAPAVMLSSRGEAAATRFALFMAALNFGGVAGAAASGPIGALLAPWQMALGAAFIFLGCTAAALRPHLLFRLEKDRVSSPPAEAESP